MHMQASAAISSDLATVHFPKQEKKKEYHTIPYPFYKDTGADKQVKDSQTGHEITRR